MKRFNMFGKLISVCTFMLLFAFSSHAQQVQSKEKKHKEVMDDDPPEVMPLLLRGPYLQVAAPTSIMVRWRTDALSRSKVWFGTNKDSLNASVEDSFLVTEHKITIRGLKPLSKYYYRIGAIKQVLQGDSNNYFMTLPESGRSGTFRIAAFGDCGNNSVNQRSVRDQLLKYLGTDPLNAWILLGDNTYPNGTDAEFQSNFFNVYKNDLLKNVPLFPSPGNHDYHDVEYSAAVAQQTHQVAYYENFSMPTEAEAGGLPSHSESFYSFDIGNIHFLSLDSYGRENGMRMYDTLGPQVEWVKKDLEKNKNVEWIIAYWHHPPFTMG
ncbi:MAG TPA: metallophosphoesterase family protein, partial [Puia sp.]|nr:metallophosphoesterase family protein [Puia sp.]